jgi:hypothetical protein
MPARWIPKMLTEEHRSKRMAALLEKFCPYSYEGEAFVESIVTETTHGFRSQTLRDLETFSFTHYKK